MGGEPPKAPYGFFQYCASTVVRSNREWSSQVRNMEGCLGSPAKRLVYSSVHFLRVRVRPTTKRQISRSSGSAAFRGISPACRPAIKTCCAESPLAPSNEVTRMTGCFAGSSIVATCAARIKKLLEQGGLACSRTREQLVFCDLVTLSSPTSDCTESPGRIARFEYPAWGLTSGPHHWELA